MHELETVMNAARMRVLHIIALASLPIVLITASMLSRPFTFDDMLSMTFWLVCSGFFAAFARLWYRSRVESIRLLLDAARRSAPSICVLEVTTFSLMHVLPFGHELDVEFPDGRHLAFGFWTRATADHAERLLRQLSEPARP